MKKKVAGKKRRRIGEEVGGRRDMWVLGTSRH
jgi:hypothetical protein